MRLEYGYKVSIVMVPPTGRTSKFKRSKRVTVVYGLEKAMRLAENWHVQLGKWFFIQHVTGEYWAVRRAHLISRAVERQQGVVNSA